MNKIMAKIIWTLFLLSFVGFNVKLLANSGESINAVSSTDVFVPGTNTGINGGLTNPRILLQPNDTVTIEGLSGEIDFMVGEHANNPADSDSNWWYLADPNGFSRFLYDNPSNQVLGYWSDNGGGDPGRYDPDRSWGHAALFLPAQPGTTKQFVGLGMATFTYTSSTSQYLKLGINDAVGYNNDGQFRARITITRKSVAFDVADVRIDENVGNAVVSVSRSDSSTASNVSYATSNGTATAGSDYTATNGTLNFAIGESTKTFNVPITNDTSVESNETINLTLSAPTNGFILGVQQTSVITINDNDTLNNNSAFVNQNVPTQMYAGETYDVMVAFKNTGTTTWAAGTYGLSSQNPLDNTTWGINRAILQNAVAPNATAFVNFTVTAPTTPGTYNFQWKTWQQGVAHFGAFSPNIPIEVLPKPTATISDSTIIEGDTGQKQATFIVSLSAPMIDQGFIDINTANGTAIAGQDYAASSPRIIFAEGQNSFSVKININGDTNFEPNETFFLNLSNGFHITIADTQAKGIIHDNEAKKISDADRDGKSDFWVFRPSNGDWYGLSSHNNNSFFSVHFGQNGDIPVGGDYDGDGYPDYAVFRPSNGVWYVYRTSDGQVSSFQFGISTDIPVQGDFDGDRKTDYAVFRPSTGTWYVMCSISNTFFAQYFGTNGDVPVKGDFDGDGRNDFAVYRPSNGSWYMLRSLDNSFYAVQFGISSDKVVPADFDGDRKTDIAVWRPSNGVWYYLKSNTNNANYGSFYFGTNGDIPSPGDFDGDGIDDFTVFRPSSGTWYSWKSGNSSMLAIPFGTNGDIPIASLWIQ